MHEAVSDVLDLRMRESDGLSRMVVVSLVAHGVLLAAVVLMPADWRGAKSARNVVPMTISLDGGAPGPNTGGMTQMSGASGSGSRAARAEAAARDAARGEEAGDDDSRPVAEAEAGVAEGGQASGQVGGPQADDGAEGHRRRCARRTRARPRFRSAGCPRWRRRRRRCEARRRVTSAAPSTSPR